MSYFSAVRATLAEQRSPGYMVTLTLPPQASSLADLQQSWRDTQAMMRRKRHPEFRAVPLQASRWHRAALAVANAAARSLALRDLSWESSTGFRLLVVRELGSKKGRPHLHVIAMTPGAAAWLLRAWMHVTAARWGVSGAAQYSIERDAETGDKNPERLAAYVAKYVSKGVEHLHEVPKGARMISATGGLRLRLQRRAASLSARVYDWDGLDYAGEVGRVPDEVRRTPRTQYAREIGALQGWLRRFVAQALDVPTVNLWLTVRDSAAFACDADARFLSDWGCAMAEGRRQAALVTIAHLRELSLGSSRAALMGSSGDWEDDFLAENSHVPLDALARHVYTILYARYITRLRGVVPLAQTRMVIP